MSIERAGPASVDRRLLALMTAFGFFAGLPLSLTSFTLSQWLVESGTSLAAIGLTAPLGLAYILKFLWSPLLDQVRPPGPLARFGRRRGWLLAIQPGLAAATAAFAAADPASRPVLLIVACLAIAFLSASQDIVIDAWRIEIFPERSQGAALAGYVWGYRIALLISGAATLRFVSAVGWHAALGSVAALMLAALLVTVLAPEPATAKVQTLGFADRMRLAIVEPFRDFWQRPGAGQILAFVMLFKLGEALAHLMAVPFYNSLGLDRTQIAYATGVPGLVSSLLGAAAGGWLVIRIGTGRALILTGFAQMASMGLYFALALSGGDPVILLTKIVVENFVESMASAAFLTYLSSLCSRAFTATQYALLSSLAAVGLRTVGGFSGVLAQALGWTAFYAMTIFAALPAMLLMVGLLRRYPAITAEAQARGA